MRIGATALAMIGALGAGLLASGGCLSGESIETTGGSLSTSTSSSGGGGDATTSSTGGGSGGEGGSGAGTGGNAPAGAGHEGQAIVNGGQIGKSPGYSMIYTVGEPIEQLGPTKSASYEIHGGLIGATGSLP